MIIIKRESANSLRVSSHGLNLKNVFQRNLTMGKLYLCDLKVAFLQGYSASNQSIVSQDHDRPALVLPNRFFRKLL